MERKICMRYKAPDLILDEVEKRKLDKIYLLVFFYRNKYFSFLYNLNLNLKNNKKHFFVEATQSSFRERTFPNVALHEPKPFDQ